jgi:hypothetical protein
MPLALPVVACSATSARIFSGIFPFPRLIQVTRHLPLDRFLPFPVLVVYILGASMSLAVAGTPSLAERYRETLVCRSAHGV